ncbi:MAG: TlpA family protein disulfide reductase [Hyphomicrobiaceae bacterium]|nr:TlpA family protein disulfide reductase [Hyphomicrobiaceae bacterium]
MRAIVPVLGLMIGVAVAAVYVSGSVSDNAPADRQAKDTAAASTRTPAGPSTAGGKTDTGANAGANTGKVAAFVYKSSPEPVPTFPFFDADQQEKTIDAFKGKVVLLNLWATWCGPCREEMPALDRLQKEMGSDKFEVVALNLDKNGFEKARAFLNGIDIKSLKFYADPSARAGSKVKAIGMPATLLVDTEGREIGRLMGPAEWDSPDAKRLIEAALR